MKIWWLRLTAESRASLVGALLIAAFLLLVAVQTAAFPPPSPPLLGYLIAPHILLIGAVAWLFVRSIRIALFGSSGTRHGGLLLLAGIPVFASAWAYDWTLSCVWVAAVFLTVRGRWGLVILAATIGNLFAAVVLDPGSTGEDVQLMLSLSLFTIFAIYVPIRLVILSDGLIVSREEIARLSVDEERFRISRDLHDLLGRTLVAISLREQSALRLLELDRPAEAAEQLRTSHRVIAEGQAKLRQLTHGPTITDLRTELASARDLCTRTGIVWDERVDEVGTPAAQLLAAAVIREAVTNMLKYSRPAHCWLRLRDEDGTLVLSVANDGCPADLKLNPAGTGLHELQARCEDVGGSLDARSPRAGFFRVLAHVPAHAEKA